MHIHMQVGLNLSFMQHMHVEGTASELSTLLQVMHSSGGQVAGDKL